MHIKYEISLFNPNWEIFNNGVNLEEHNYKKLNKSDKKDVLNFYCKLLYDLEKNFKGQSKIRVPFAIFISQIIACIHKYSLHEFTNKFENETNFWEHAGIIIDRSLILRSLCYLPIKAPFRALIWHHRCEGINLVASNINRDKTKLEGYEVFGDFSIQARSWSELDLHLYYTNEENYKKAFSTILFSELINFYKEIFIII
tara:strand:- start:435 stop:1034 length:600 start_codon:yes stop_codon:yes gene_type:complete